MTHKLTANEESLRVTAYDDEGREYDLAVVHALAIGGEPARVAMAEVKHYRLCRQEGRKYYREPQERAYLHG